MVDDFIPQAWFFVLAGFIGGIVLFARGLIAYRRDRLVSSVATSSLDGIAAGEVLVSGTVDPIGPALVSPLQSKPCVWYRSKIEETGEHGRVLLDEERAQEFLLDDGTAKMRVIPRGARWEVGPVFDESTGIAGDEPPGLDRRRGSTYARLPDVDPESMTEAQREAARRALLTVRAPERTAAPAPVPSLGLGDGLGIGLGAELGLGVSIGEGRKKYREARLEPGETITIVGQALPWGDLKDVLHAWDASSNVEATIAEDIAAARRAGLLASSPEEAWGNAAIPGFGIGLPVKAPELDADARPAEIAAPETVDDFIGRHDLPDEALVLSRGQSGEMAVYKGPPPEAAMHHDFAFALGVMGALLTIFSALGLGFMITGGF